MSTGNPRRRLANELAAAAAAYQAAAVVPHCTRCTKPCCRLDVLVLELEWKQLKSFWRLEESRPAFDRRLSAGQGPEEIRAGNGLYYIHSKPCPAYDETRGSCRVYDQELKPAGCSDFPVYEDGGSIVADLRCEAVDLAALVAWVARAVGPEFRVVHSADGEFPFLVTLSLRKVSARAAPGKGRSAAR
ncbi:MAG: YkgJ family cysteine cluster protein [Bacteroidota bacterium]